MRPIYGHSMQIFWKTKKTGWFLAFSFGLSHNFVVKPLIGIYHLYLLKEIYSMQLRAIMYWNDYNFHLQRNIDATSWINENARFFMPRNTLTLIQDFSFLSVRPLFFFSMYIWWWKFVTFRVFRCVCGCVSVCVVCMCFGN